MSTSAPAPPDMYTISDNLSHSDSHSDSRSSKHVSFSDTPSCIESSSYSHRDTPLLIDSHADSDSDSYSDSNLSRSAEQPAYTDSDTDFLCPIIGNTSLIVLTVRDSRGRVLKALIDTAADLDYVSKAYVSLSDIKCFTSQQKMNIQLGNGETVSVPRVKTHPINLFIDASDDSVLRSSRRYNVMETLPGGYDFIFGLPFLSYFDAYIATRSKRVVFCDPSDDSSYEVTPLITEFSSDSIPTPVFAHLDADRFARAMRKSTHSLYVAYVREVQTAPSEGIATDSDSHLVDRLDSLCDEFKHLFEPRTGLPPKRAVDHRIDLLPDQSPPHKHTYRLSQPELIELRKQIDVLLENGWIRPSVSPYGAPILFAKKKDGSLRLCVDYRALNKITIKNHTSIPIISELFDSLHGAKYFTSLDLQSGYHQIRINESDVHKTAFNTRFGHFEWLVLCFGLTSAPATFQTLMNSIFHDMISSCVLVYLDDILIYSKTIDDHVAHVRAVLERLSEHDLRVQRKKCTFGASHLEFLGHIVSADGIQTDPRKIAPINDWPVPTSQKEVQQFLGLANYFRSYIPHFAQLAHHLTPLTGSASKKKIKWTEPAQHSFDSLKYALTHTPVLALPDFTAPFILTTDASDFAIGMMLSQLDDSGSEHPIAFESHILTSNELNWPTHEKEAFSIVYACKKWRHYLESGPVTVYTDHKALLELQTQPNLTRRQARWLERLQEFDLHYQHLPGRLNIVADALSRRPDFVLSATLASSATRAMTDPDAHDSLRSYYPADSTFGPIYSALLAASPSSSLSFPPSTLDRTSSPTTAVPSPSSSSVQQSSLQQPPVVQQSSLQQSSVEQQSSLRQPAVAQQSPTPVLLPPHLDRYFMDPATQLIYLVDQDQHRLCVPASPWRLLLVREAHDPPYSAHRGQQQTYAKLSRSYFWPQMHKLVSSYIRSCDTCQRTKTSRSLKSGFLNPLEIPPHPWHTVSMDFILQLPPTVDNSYDTLFVVVDKFSKRAHFIPCFSTTTAAQAADLYIDNIFKHHGLAVSIISDRDSKFTSEFWLRLHERLGTRLRMSTPMRPQTDGQTERTNQVIEDMLRTCINYAQDDWDRLLPTLEFAYNDSVSASTTFTPFFLEYGRHPRSPLSSLAAPSPVVPLPVPDATLAPLMAAQAQPDADTPLSASDYAQRFQHNLQIARDAQQVAQLRQARYYNARHRLVEYAVGDRVLVDLACLPSDVQHVRPMTKLAHKRVGEPFEIVARVGRSAYKLRMPANTTSHDVFHVSTLTPYVENPFPNRVPSPPPPVVTDLGNTEFEVEHVLAHKTPPGRFAGYRYLVKWVGFPSYRNTWEPRKNLIDVLPDGSTLPNKHLLAYERDNHFTHDDPPIDPNYATYKRNRYRLS